jgi:hypothetical protein
LVTVVSFFGSLFYLERIHTENSGTRLSREQKVALSTGVLFRQIPVLELQPACLLLHRSLLLGVVLEELYGQPDEKELRTESGTMAPSSMPSSKSASATLGQIIEYIPGMFGYILLFRLDIRSNAVSHCYPMPQTLAAHSNHTAGCFMPSYPYLQYLLIPAVTFPVSILTIADRLYLAAYTQPPTADTLFPYPEVPVRCSPTKRGYRAAETSRPVHSAVDRKVPCYFSIDDQLLYNAFHHDFGPLHIGHIYRFALMFHDILGAKENKDRPVVFWSKADPRSMAFDPPPT